MYRYPATAALTTGYPFRIENPGTVYYLQRISKTAHLTTLSVSSLQKQPPVREYLTYIARFLLVAFHFACGYVAKVYLLQNDNDIRNEILLTISLQFAGFSRLALASIPLALVWTRYSIGEFVDVMTIGLLVLSRLFGVFTIRQRTYRGGLWKGASEPGVHGDLLVLLTQDRWVRIKGLVDDLKAVTSGLWLADPTPLESALGMMSKLLVYMAVAVNFNSDVTGSLSIALVLFYTALNLSWANSKTTSLYMHGRELKVVGQPKKYARRRDLADELIRETGRRDWAVALGMVPAEKSKGDKEQVVVT